MSQPREHKRTDDLVEELAAEAEHGYDLSKGRPVDRRSLTERLSGRASSSGSTRRRLVTGAPALAVGGCTVGDEEQERNYEADQALMRLPPSPRMRARFQG
jgi:hypothetical protein